MDSGRVPRRLEHLETHVAEVDGVAVRHRLEGVLRLCSGAEVDLGAGPIAQLEVARDEVGVEVGEEHVVDRAAEALRRRRRTGRRRAADRRPPLGRSASSATRYEACARQPR